MNAAVETSPFEQILQDLEGNKVKKIGSERFDDIVLGYPEADQLCIAIKNNTSCSEIHLGWQGLLTEKSVSLLKDAILESAQPKTLTYRVSPDAAVTFIESRSLEKQNNVALLDSLRTTLKGKKLSLDFQPKTVDGKPGYTISVIQDKKGWEALRPAAAREVKNAFSKAFEVAGMHTANIETKSGGSEYWLSEETATELRKQIGVIQTDPDYRSTSRVKEMPAATAKNFLARMGRQDAFVSALSGQLSGRQHG